MKILFKGKEVADFMIGGHTMTTNEILAQYFGLDSVAAESEGDQELLKQMYNDKEYVYLDDCGIYCLDVDGFTFD